MDIQKFESYLKIKHSYYSNPSVEALLCKTLYDNCAI